MPEQPEAKAEISELSFEAALKRLEEIVRKLEGGEASLEESIALYGEGDRLKQQCEARLQAAKARIESSIRRALRRWILRSVCSTQASERNRPRSFSHR